VVTVSTPLVVVPEEPAREQPSAVARVRATPMAQEAAAWREAPWPEEHPPRELA
jgi:hypothetical protein